MNTGDILDGYTPGYTERTDMARRAAGEGSIHKTADGKRWVGWLELPPDPDTGKRRRRQLRAKTKAEVAERLAEARREAADGVVVGRDITVAAYLTAWTDARAASGEIAGSTVDNYRHLAKIVTKYLGHRRVRDLLPTDVERLAVRMLADDYSPATVSRARAVLNGACKAAVRDRILASNPVTLTRGPRQRPAVRRFLTVKQIHALLDHARDHDDIVVYTGLAVAIGTGIRRGELLALRWSDVDLERRQLRITRQLVRSPGAGLIETDVKTQSSARTVSIPSITADALSALRTARPALPAALVLTDGRGGHYPPERWSRDVTRLTSTVLGEKFGAHDLRHASASLAFAAGVPLRVVSEQLGHAGVAITGDIYVALIGGTATVGTAIDEVLAR